MIERRAYQQQAFWGFKKLRRYLLAWLRQGGKTTTLAEQSLLEMAENVGRLITFVSCSLNVGSEFVEKEAQAWVKILGKLRAMAAERKLQLAAGYRKHGEDADSWKELPVDIDEDALCDCLDKSRFELRLRHSNTTYSRTKVIAPNIATARSWSGSVKFDEIAFVRDLRTLLAELEPIFSTDPSFNLIMSTTPPPDFAHYAYEYLTAEDGREVWPVLAEGNWYRNRAGIWVHRVTVDDAYLSGRQIYDQDTGESQTPDENREGSPDKEGWDRSNRLKRPTVGTSAISPLALDTAQRKGLETCHASEWPANLAGIPAGLLQACKGTVSLGLDLATTEKKKSNPSALAVVGKQGADYIVPALAWWKTADPNVTTVRVVMVVKALLAMGVRIVRLEIDATNERYYAGILRGALSGLCQVTLRVGSERVGPDTGNVGEAVLFKAWKGNLLSNAAESGKLIMAFNRYCYDDCMRVVRVGGSFDCTVGPNGEHGDTFDAIALGMSGLASGGPVEAHFPGAGDMDGGRSKDPSWLDRAKDYIGLNYA